MANVYNLSVRKTEMILCDDHDENDGDSLENIKKKLVLVSFHASTSANAHAFSRVVIFYLTYVGRFWIAIVVFWSVDACHAAKMFLDICHVLDLIKYTYVT